MSSHTKLVKIKKESTDRPKKKPHSSCSLCGIFSTHTAKGHSSTLKNSHSMNITDLRRWTKMNITDPMKNYWEIADSEAKTLLDMPPKPSMETATTTYEQLACCPGRIYYSLLYHHKQLCSELTAFQVFAWACYISYGHLTDVL